jgi:hypothetical protein
MPLDDEQKELKSTITEKITEFAVPYINMFHTDIGKCESLYDYYSLMAAIFTFGKLALSKFKDDLINQRPMIDEIDKVAEDIAREVIAGYNKKMN